MMERVVFKNIAKKIAQSLKDIPQEWDGKESILAMKDGGSRQWRQMEWIGFYFEFLCNKLLSAHDSYSTMMNDERCAYGNTQFDGFLEIPWDYKVHAKNTSNHTVVLNDYEAIKSVIKKYGSVGVIVAIGEAEYNDENRFFQTWHNNLKGGVSDYEKDRIRRGVPSRRRKTKFTLQQILFIQINESVLKKTGLFQKGFRNADGSPRRKKVLLDLENLSDTDYFSVDF